MIEVAAQESGYLMELETERTVEAEGRIENIRELAGVAMETIARDPDADLASFLELVSLVGEQDGYEEEDSSVTLMTLHIAKGLEFPVVFIVGMEDGVFPHFRSMTDQHELEEERRLAYVGITRAQQRLYLHPRVEPDAVRPGELEPAVAVPRRAPRRRRRPARSRRRSRRPEPVRRAAGGPTGRGRPAAVATRWWGSRAARGPSRSSAAGSRRGPPASSAASARRQGRATPCTTSGGARASSSRRAAAGDDIEATIRFTDGGEKRLLLAYAPLTKVG